MKYKKTFLLAIFLLLGMSVYAQTVDVLSTICKTVENSKRGEGGGLGDTIFRPYIPYMQEGFIPVRVTLVFLQQDDETGGFQAGNQEHQRIWDEVEIKINQIYANLKDSDLPLCYNWKDPFLTDTKIRFKFHRVYIKDSYAWNRCNNTQSYFGIQNPPLYYIEYIQKRIEEDNSIPHGINIFFTENSKLYEKYIKYGNYIPEYEDSVAKYAAASFPGDQYIQIHMPDIYCKYLWMKFGVTHHKNIDWENTALRGLVNSLAILMAHELGHCLDLNHWCSHYNENECQPALMHQGGDVEYTHNYIPPTEIGKMHKALMETNLKNFVASDAPIFGTWRISNLTLQNLRIYSNLYIPSGGKTYLSGSCFVPPKSRIEVEGLLHIKKPFWMAQNPAIIRCQDKNSSWEGIRVRRGGVLYLENTRIIDYDIIMEGGSTLVLAGSIDVQNGHRIILDSGVFVCVSSFTKSADKPFYANVNTLVKGIPADISRLYGISCGQNKQWDAFVASINPILETLYLQNQDIENTNTFVGKTILIGNSVDGNRVKGDVVIKSPARATFIYKDRILLDKGFRCESGGSYKVLQYK